MAAPHDFVPVRLTTADERAGRKQMRDMLGRDWWRRRSRAAFAGFAAEHALERAVNAKPGPMWCRMADTLKFDLVMGQGVDSLKDYEAREHALEPQRPTLCEVKCRTVTRGWVHPDRFDYVNVPMHDGREPIKDVDLVWFCWYSMAAPRRLWVLGFVRGRDEFQDRAVFYREGEALPRGGWARPGGEYVVEIQNLRPVPRGMLKEDE